MKKKSKDQQMMVQYEEAMKQIKKMSVICSFIIVLVISISTLIPNPSYALLEEKTLPETFSLEESDAYLEEIETIFVKQYQAVSDNGDMDSTYAMDREAVAINNSKYQQTSTDFNRYPGILYILDQNDFKTNNAKVNYYLTQLAIWWYEDIIDGYANDKNYVAVVSDDGAGSRTDVIDQEATVDERYDDSGKYRFDNRLSALEKKMITENTSFGSNIVDLVTKAVAYQLPSATLLNIPSAQDITYHITGDYLETNDIKVSSDDSGLVSYQVKLDSSDLEVVDSTGQVKKESFAANEPFRLRILLSKLENQQINLSATVTGIFRHLNGAFYYPTSPEPAVRFNNFILGSATKQTITDTVHLDYQLETGSVTIHKVDAQTDKALAGATFVITDSKGSQVAKFTTTNQPYDITLPTGNYTLTETIVPDNYNIEQANYEFSVEKDTKTEVKVTNTKEIAVPNTSLNMPMIYTIGGIIIAVGVLLIVVALKPQSKKK